MRSAVFYGAISLDGYLADRDQQIDWLEKFEVPDAINQAYTDFVATIDTLIIGRNSFDYVASQFAEYPYPELMNYVYTSRPLPQASTQIQVPTQTPTELVKSLKNQPGQDLWIVGGGRIVTELIANQQLDKMIIQVAPILLGGGYRLFEALDQQTQFELVSVVKMGQYTEMTLVKK